MLSGCDNQLHHMPDNLQRTQRLYPREPLSHRCKHVEILFGMFSAMPYYYCAVRHVHRNYTSRRQ